MTDENPIGDALYALTWDRSYSELFQYIKEFWSFLLLIGLCISQRTAVFGGWAVLFGYMLMDDYFRIHERMGPYLMGFLPGVQVSGMRPQDIGEIIYLTLVGLGSVPLLAVSYRFSKTVARQIQRHLFILVAALAACGIVVDSVHMLSQHPWWDLSLSVLEDGGEMIVMSIICAYLLQRSGDQSTA